MVNIYWYNWYNWSKKWVFRGFAGVFLSAKSPLLSAEWQKMAVVRGVERFCPIRCGFFVKFFWWLGLVLGVFGSCCSGWCCWGGCRDMLGGVWCRGDGWRGWYFSGARVSAGGVATVSFQVGITKTCVVWVLTNMTKYFMLGLSEKKKNGLDIHQGSMIVYIQRKDGAGLWTAKGII